MNHAIDNNIYNLLERLKSIDGEGAIIERKPNNYYHIICKKRMINADGSDAGWLYTYIPNVKLNENGKYVIEPLKDDEIGNRAERRKLKRKKR